MLCFGVKEFSVIPPQSASGVVLDAPEACKLLSAVAIALSNCSRFQWQTIHVKKAKAVGASVSGTAHEKESN
ncbi:hypothetical protein V6N11_081956 [Hibiscus sabdariffa]|uniref:Uncharacterized protein n=1 Tax=Hibiscus sabdariffa TaxID=183260 RepID=A0ABR2Q870_9ROSI